MRKTNILQIELPSHFDAVALENLIRDCWAKVEWGYGRNLVRDGEQRQFQKQFQQCAPSQGLAASLARA